MSIGYPDPTNRVKPSSSPGNTGILVVDEDPAFQLGLKTFLKEYVGFDQVFSARGGAEALKLIESEESIEIVTLDYEMPGMNGIEVLKNLAATEHRPLSVMMITGYPSDDLEAEFRSFQASNLLTADFVAKPVEFEKLEPLVMRAHEELLAGKNAAEAPQPVGNEVVEVPLHAEEPGDLEHSMAEMEAKLSAQSLQLDELKKEVGSQQGRWRSDVFIVIILALATWIAAEFGLFESLKPKWEQLKSDVKESFVPAKPAPPGATDPVPLPEAQKKQNAIPLPMPRESPDPAPDSSGDPL